MNEKSNDQRGFITIEATFSLVMFIAAVACIISLINIFTLHNRVQYAITQTANQFSTYMYIYDGLGIQDAVETFDKNSDIATEGINNSANDIANTAISANKFGESIATVLSQFGGIATSTGHAAQSANDMVNNGDISIQNIESFINELKQIRTSVDDTKQSIDDAKCSYNTMVQDFNTAKDSTSAYIKSIQENPYSLALTIFYLAANELEDYFKETISENLAYAMTEQYLMGDSASDYLEAAGVVGGYDGLSFKGTNFFEPVTKAAEGKSYSSDSSRSLNVLQIDVVVSYEVELNFAFMPLSDNTVTIVQRASTAAWTGHEKS
ncbi:MAG: hypothetical protein J6K17_13345 [Oscillospiraceae bacterium]|nr:hypothetical protein [Oscillospiraceae bacterium]